MTEKNLVSIKKNSETSIIVVKTTEHGWYMRIHDVWLNVMLFMVVAVWGVEEDSKNHEYVFLLYFNINKISSNIFELLNY